MFVSVKKRRWAAGSVMAAAGMLGCSGASSSRDLPASPPTDAGQDATNPPVQGDHDDGSMGDAPLSDARDATMVANADATASDDASGGADVSEGGDVTEPPDAPLLDGAGADGPVAVCASGEAQCSTSGNALQTCGPDGQWASAVACDAGTTCLGGACAGACGPGDQRCSGSTLQSCDGGGWQSATTCSARPPNARPGLSAASPCHRAVRGE